MAATKHKKSKQYEQDKEAYSYRRGYNTIQNTHFLLTIKKECVARNNNPCTVENFMIGGSSG